MSKKKLIIIITSVLVMILVIGVGVFAYGIIKNNNDKSRAEVAAKNTPAAKKAAADTKKLDGVKALTEGDTGEAKRLLIEARDEYKSVNDNDGVVDTAAQLYFIEHPSTPSAATVTTREAAG